MNEYSIEFFVESHEDGTVESLNLNEENEECKKEMEARALSEYYKRKIIISSKKFD